ncbi:Polyadenylate-binding protein 2-A-like protein [Drosera capensis]
MEAAGERTFRVSYSGEGVVKLRAAVTDKLKELMGEYTDDTLVEYVIVLLKNGRRKDEAKTELDVFLGDDSDPFVTWLWDHLSSNIDKYIVPNDPRPEEAAKVRLARVEHATKSLSHDMEVDSETEKHEKLQKPQQARERKGVVRNMVQPPSVYTSNLEDVYKERKPYLEDRHKKHSGSPEPASHQKRRRPEEYTRFKEESVSRGSMNAPKRLLQFAVRDAVATSRPSHSLSEPASKRLRSVVSSSTVDSTSGARPWRLHSIASLKNPLATAFRSIAEAAEDVVKKYKPSGNVFDRLSRGEDADESIRQVSNLRSGIDEEYNTYGHDHEGTDVMDHQADVYGHEYVTAKTIMESDSGLAYDSASDNEGYDALNVVTRGVQNVSQTGTSNRKKNDDSVMVQYSVAPNTDPPSRTRDQDPSVAMASTSRKIVNISVNVNTWKPTHYQPSVAVQGPKAHKSLPPLAVDKSSEHFMIENSRLLTGKPAVDTQNEGQKSLRSVVVGGCILLAGSYSTSHPLEDADSRTIFVNNVHFAATKDSLSRHFNKFGEVLKVLILVDPSTGLPKGSAYVEFMQKEAAENALSLDGTSFMSRMQGTAGPSFSFLVTFHNSVVRKSGANLEATPVMPQPRLARGSPFTMSRFTRAPFPRLFPGAYRARPLIRPGARSLQWKRDSDLKTPGGTISSSSMSGVGAAPSPRGLTYVRPELKTDANPAAA